MTCAEITDLFEDYIAGSATPAERSIVDEHVHVCPPCGAILRELEEAAAMVWLALPQVEPPARLRQRVLTAVRAAPPPLAGPAVVVPGPPRTRRRLWPLALNHLAAAMSALALLLVVGLGAWVVTLQNDVNRLVAENTRLNEQLARQRYAVYALRESLDLMSSTARAERALRGSEAAPQARGVLYYDPQGRQAMVVTSELPRPAPDRSYQVWLRGKGGVISAGLLTFDERDVGYAVLDVPGPVGQFEAVGISNEPAGGSPQPTGQRMMGGTL